MSLGIVIKCPEGLVLAAESRVTLTLSSTQGAIIERTHLNFDNASKLLSFTDQPNRYYGAVTYGQAVIGQRTAQSFMPEFESGLVHPTTGRLTVEAFAQHMSDFFMQQWNLLVPQPYNGGPMIFAVGGFNVGEPHGRVYQFSIPNAPHPVEQNPGNFGILWGGQSDIVDRIILGYDRRLIQGIQNTLSPTPPQLATLQQQLQGLRLLLPFDVYALQDCVDLAIFFLRSTIQAQNLSVTIRGCGGHIDIATITRTDGLIYVQRKQVVGERV